MAIGGNQGKIGLPRLPDSGIPVAGSVSNLEEPSFGTRRLPELTVRSSEFGWGYVSSSRGDTFIHALRVRIAVGSQHNEIPNQLSGFGRAFDAWFSIVRDWICAWSGQVRDRDRHRDECHIHATIRNKRQAGLYGSGVTLGSVLVVGERAATRDEVIAAFDCASANYRLPLHHTLLQRAQSDAMVGNYRRAVIDACTATEVSLGNAVRRTLKSNSVPDETAKNTLRQVTGVVELFRLFVILGARPSVSEGRVINQLAQPRNEAAHAGDSSTLERARNAIETAGRILAAADGVPTTVQARRSARSGIFG